MCVQVTNDFSFVFCAVGSNPLRPVEPESLREAVQYMAAHRWALAVTLYADITCRHKLIWVCAT